jgi:quercetin dioxygenase-like cupin family protein
MKKMSVSQATIPPNESGLIMRPLFGPETKPREAVHMGHAVFSPGLRVPQAGVTRHDGDEFSYILSGSIKCYANGETQTLKSGDAVYIPAGEGHYSYNDNEEDCSLIYMLVKTI